MSRAMKAVKAKPRTTRMWAIVGPRGKVYHVAPSAFLAWATIYNPQSYQERDERHEYMERHGFTCQPVTITAEEPPHE